MTCDYLSPPAAILVAIADDAVRNALSTHLKEEGYRVMTAADGRTAFFLATRHPLLLALLDVQLPLRDGLELCRLLRTHDETASLPILLLASTNDEMETIVGLEVGADDYVVWPVNWKMFHARLRALLRRSRYLQSQPSPDHQSREKETGAELVVGDLRIDLAGHTVMRRDQPLDLSARLFDLLVYFVRHRGIVLPRKHLMERVLLIDPACEERLVDVYIHWLREKLEDDSAHPHHIQTVRGIGYRFVEE
jgi:two-component system alkaline phosphatase synthesis response regulator PhoP